LSNIIARFLIVTIISGSTLNWLAPAAQACKCGAPMPVRQSVKIATMVFRGKVLSVETLKAPKGHSRRVKFVLNRV
jgi:hypothetical protein